MINTIPTKVRHLLTKKRAKSHYIAALLMMLAPSIGFTDLAHPEAPLLADKPLTCAKVLDSTLTRYCDMSQKCQRSKKAHITLTGYLNQQGISCQKKLEVVSCVHKNYICRESADKSKHRDECRSLGITSKKTCATYQGLKIK